MAQPTFRRFWIRILPDGSALPQFNPVTGKYCGYEEYRGPVAQILFYPITPGLAERIQANGDRAEPSNLPVLSFEVLPGSKADMHRSGTLRYDLKRICGFCGTEFDPEQEECPCCLNRNQWYCGKCDELKRSYIVELELQALNPLDEEHPLEKLIRIPWSLLPAARQLVHNIPGRWGLKGVQVRCLQCEATEPRGLKHIQHIGEFYDEKLLTHYVLTIDGEKHIILDYWLRR